MRRYSLTHAALDDLGLIIDYMAARNPSAARRVRDELFEAFGLLADHPLMGHRHPDLRKLSVVDVTGCAIMTRARILPTLSYDHHFTVAGFKMVA